MLTDRHEAVANVKQFWNYPDLKSDSENNCRGLGLVISSKTI